MKKIDKNNDNYIYYWVGYRKAKGWSQDKLATEAHYTCAFISRIENNAFQTFSLNTLYHLVKGLDISIKELFEELEEDKK